MSGVFLAVSALAYVIIVLCLWLGWQLLRQNGRMLLRLDELETRLDEFEFGGADEQAHLTNGEADGETTEPLTPSLSPSDGERVSEGRERGDRASRFGNRSLARSRIKRDGLKAGTSAPSFRLPRLDGGELSLEELRGKRVLLVFSDPHCGPCQALSPELEKFHRKQSERPLTLTLFPSAGERETASGVAVVMISRGEPNENRAKVKEHGLTFPILLQQRWEISRRYAMFATPVAYLIDESGIITHDVAAGVDSILKLCSSASPGNGEKSKASFALQSPPPP